MKKIKKMLLLMSVVATALLCFAFSASAKTVAATGQCGENVTYTYNSSTKKLVISGTGAMTDYSSSDSPFYVSDIKSVVIKDGVTAIGDYSFNSTSLESVTIPDSVKAIGENAFDWCKSLENVTIPDGVKTIGEYAFFCCEKLKNITIGNSVRTIGGAAFSGCKSLESVTIPDSVRTIGSSAFYECKSLASVTIGSDVTTIGNRAFYDCNSLTNITVDESNQNYSSDKYGALFNIDKTTLIQYPVGNKRTAYIIPDSVTYIGDYAFYNCDKLTDVTIGNSVTTIGYYAFEDCDKLMSVSLGNSVESIRNEAFRDCDSLISVTIPDSVTHIYDRAFYFCYNIKDVYYSGTQEQWEKIDIKAYNDDLIYANIYFKSSVAKPIPPATITATQTTSTITLSWSKSAGATGYRVYQYSPSKGKYVQIASVKGVTSYKKSKNLKAGSQYKFKIKPYVKLSDGTVIWGDDSRVFTTATKPLAPTKVTASTTKTTITLSWSKSAGATGYRVYQYSPSKGKYVQIASVKGVTSYKKSNSLKAGTSYSFRIKPYVKLSDGTVIWGDDSKTFAFKTAK